jgi:hypothetical protein
MTAKEREKAALVLVQPRGGRDLDFGYLQRHFQEASRHDRAAEAGRVTVVC